MRHTHTHTQIHPHIHTHTYRNFSHTLFANKKETFDFLHFQTYIFQLAPSIVYEADDLIPPSSDEIKEGQWMGVTVRSQGVGGKVSIEFIFIHTNVYIILWNFLID